MDIQLSEHFKLSEFTKSSVATARGIDNVPSIQEVSNLQQLCLHVLEPLREHFGIPIKVTSGYRCPDLNAAVGGVHTSQHVRGEAADIVPIVEEVPGSKSQDPSTKPFPETLNQEPETADAIIGKWYNWLRQRHPLFDQLILEKRGGKTWLHVSYKQTGKNRKQAFEQTS